MEIKSIIIVNNKRTFAAELLASDNTVCPRSSDTFYIVSYYIKWVTTSWTHSSKVNGL